ncbi:hypothetical protein [Sporosarcina sp. JAI121]|uniref:hypothetical protein n=1 Tax=Sporosarcina sp. JAI121 TaxID=2723064 RepID=UPI0015C7DD1C|nr:hypothetical protein [Sporosarcina sp. JAI121]NYF25497.1 hypothetical protein [Sporosarcina sp. JAI121]
MKRLGLYNFLNLIVPSIIIMIIGYVSFTDMFFQQTDHKYFLISLLIIYPALFLIQGVLTAICKSNIFISLGVSVLGFLVTIFTWANSSAIGYVFVYLLVGLVGYGIVRLFKKGKQQPKIT